jgi:methionine synthase I (cobalamin-dependent)
VDSVQDLLSDGVLLLDGAMGSMLLSMGLEAGRAPDEWNLERPQAVESVHRAYRQAGADILLTNTFGSNRIRLRAAKAESDHDEVNRSAVSICRKAADGCLVSGDIGPSGVYLSPVGDAKPEELASAFADQARVLEAAGVDLFSIETMSDLREAEIALAAVRSVSEKPVMVSMTFSRTPKGFHTVMGDSVEKCCSSLVEAGANLIGANCTLSSRDMIELSPLLVSGSSVPVVIQPNAGQPRVSEGEIRYDQTPEEFVSDMLVILEHGARVLGGCCGTNPHFMRALREAIDERSA